MRSRAGRVWTAARRVGSPRVLLALGVPLLLVAVAVAAGRLGAGRALETWAVRGWSLGLGVALVCSLANALRSRQAAPALAGVAALCALLHPFVWQAGRMQGEVDLGEQEESAPWRAMERGALASLPVLYLGEVERGAASDVSLRVDGRVVRVPFGRRLDVGGGVVIEVRGPFPAPRFTVKRGGALEAEGLIKLEPGTREYIEPGILPHRLYLSVPAGEYVLGPAKLHLRVQRGKLKVLEREIARDERVEFEGVALTFSEGAAWVRAEVRKGPRPWLLIGAALLAVASGGLALRHRRVGR